MRVRILTRPEWSVSGIFSGRLVGEDLTTQDTEGTEEKKEESDEGKITQ
jgi:hypothetical protein